MSGVSILAPSLVRQMGKVELSWDHEHGGRLRAGCMAILTWRGRDDHALDVVDDPWLREYHRATWQYL